MNNNLPNYSFSSPRGILIYIGIMSFFISPFLLMYAFDSSKIRYLHLYFSIFLFIQSFYILFCVISKNEKFVNISARIIITLWNLLVLTVIMYFITDSFNNISLFHFFFLGLYLILSYTIGPLKYKYFISKLIDHHEKPILKNDISQKDK